MRLQAVTQQSRKTIIDQRIAARQTCCYTILREIVLFDNGTPLTFSAAAVPSISSTTMVNAGPITDSASVCAFLRLANK